MSVLKENRSVGFRKEEYVGRNTEDIHGCPADLTVTAVEWWNATLSHTTTISRASVLTSTFSHILWCNDVVRWSVWYGWNIWLMWPHTIFAYCYTHCDVGRSLSWNSALSLFPAAAWSISCMVILIMLILCYLMTVCNVIFRFNCAESAFSHCSWQIRWLFAFTIGWLSG